MCLQLGTIFFSNIPEILFSFLGIIRLLRSCWMNSSELNNRFDRLVKALTSKTIFVTMGDDPVYYFVFSPSDALMIKRKLHILEAKLRHEGYSPNFFSLGKHLHEFI